MRETYETEETFVREPPRRPEGRTQTRKEKHDDVRHEAAREFQQLELHPGREGVSAESGFVESPPQATSTHVRKPAVSYPFRCPRADPKVARHSASCHLPHLPSVHRTGRREHGNRNRPGEARRDKVKCEERTHSRYAHQHAPKRPKSTTLSPASLRTLAKQTVFLIGAERTEMKKNVHPMTGVSFSGGAG